MKRSLIILTALLALVGFLMPAAWVAAGVCGVFALGVAPAGRRADGARRTGGLLGGLWDDTVVAHKMLDCPVCKQKVSREAKKCPHCGEWLKED